MHIEIADTPIAAAADLPADPGRREALRRFSASAMLPLAAALPFAASAQTTPVYPPAPETIPPFPSVCMRPGLVDGLSAASAGVTFPFEDPLNDLKTVFDIGLNLIPGIGGVLAAVFDLFFPALSGPNLWDQIKQKIEAAINQAIEEEAIKAMQVALRGSEAPSASPGGLQGLVGTFVRDIGNYRPGDTLLDGEAINIRSTFIDQVGFFQPLGWEQQTLPLFVQFANLHLLFLREVIRHGANYGVAQDTITALQSDIDGYTDSQGVHHDGYLKQYCDYVDTTLPGVKAKLQQKYESAQNVDWYEGTNLEICTAADGNSGDADLDGYIPVGAWKAKQQQNAILTLMTHAVEDYRALWPTMMDAGGSGVSLPREVYLGPYGIPDMRDLGITLQGDPDNGWAFNGVPAVAAPVPAAAPLDYIAVPCTSITSQKRNWAFPNAVVFNTPMPNMFGISLAEQWGGPVVGVKVDVGKYISRTSNPFSGMPCSAGYLIGEIYFTQQNGHTHVVGGDDRVYKEMKSFSGEVLGVPQGHMLSGVTEVGTVRQLYDNVGASGRASIGSLIFGFRLIDPDLKLSSAPSLLRSLYVSSASGDFDDLIHIVQAAALARGFDFADAATLKALLATCAEAYEWDIGRSLFQASLARLPQRSGAA